MTFLRLYPLIFSCLALIGLSSCDRSEKLAPTVFESSTIINLTEIPGFSIEQEIKSATSDQVIAESAKKTGLPKKQILEALSASKAGQPLQIKISAIAETAEQATEIAAAAADSYIAIRNAREVARAMKELKGLDEKLEKQAALVKQHREELTKLIDHYGIPQTQQKTKSKLTEFHIQLVELKAQLATLSGIDLNADITQAAAIEIEGYDIAGEYQKYRDATKQLAELEAAGIGSRHPSIVAAEKIKKATKKATKDEFRDAITMLKTKKELLENQLKRLKEVTRESLGLNEKSSAYKAAKAAYEKSRDKLRALKEQQK